MAGNFDELKELLRELLNNRFAPQPVFTRGLLGDGLGNVTVPDRPDKNFVRFNRSSTEFFEVFNVTVNAVNDWPILIGELPWLPGLTQVVGTDWAAYEQSGWDDNVGATSPHSPTHEWPDGTPGSDAVNIYMRSIVPLRAYTLGTGSTTIYANSYEYENPNGSGSVWGGLPGIDLAPIMSSMSTGTARLMGIYLDPNINTLGIVTGVTDIFTDASDPPSPQYPQGIIPVARIRVYGGQVSIGEIDIRDTRQPFVSSSRIGAWPNSTEIVIGTTRYTTLEEAITAAVTGEVILFRGTHLITGASLSINKAITLQGINPEQSLITSTLANDATVDLSFNGAVLRDCKVTNTAASGTTNRAVEMTTNGTLCDNVVADCSATGTNSVAFYSSSVGIAVHRLRSCRGTASGGTNNYGTDFAAAVVAGISVEGGFLSGAQGDARSNASGVVLLINPILENGVVTITSGEVTGFYFAGDGTWHQAISEDISGSVSLYQNAAVAATVNYAKAFVENKKATVIVRLTSTATGTTANNIYILLPDSLTPISGISLFQTLGTGLYLDAGTALYDGTVAYPADIGGLPAMALKESNTIDSGLIGVNPAIAIASGDIYSINLTFEIA